MRLNSVRCKYLVENELPRDVRKSWKHPSVSLVGRWAIGGGNAVAFLVYLRTMVVDHRSGRELRCFSLVSIAGYPTRRAAQLARV